MVGLCMDVVCGECDILGFGGVRRVPEPLHELRIIHALEVIPGIGEESPALMLAEEAIALPVLARVIIHSQGISPVA
jgi:hypothetical protein